LVLSGFFREVITANMDKLSEKHIDTSRGFHYRYYASPSSSSKYTLLLLHGYPDSALLYAPVIPELLKTGLRIIVPDLLGYDGTSKPEDPKHYEWKGQSQDLLEILKQENVSDNIISVGHDWGSVLN
jgi:soluble epoxide hydrolase / lipid-phosphate phosphatase